MTKNACNRLRAHGDRQFLRLALAVTAGPRDPSCPGSAQRTGARSTALSIPAAAPWVSHERPDYGTAITAVVAPTLLLWGDADPLSPVPVGQRLAELLPAGALHVLSGGTTAWLRSPDEVASLITNHIV